MFVDGFVFCISYYHHNILVCNFLHTLQSASGTWLQHRVFITSRHQPLSDVLVVQTDEAKEMGRNGCCSSLKNIWNKTVAHAYHMAWSAERSQSAEKVREADFHIVFLYIQHHYLVIKHPVTATIWICLSEKLVYQAFTVNIRYRACFVAVLLCYPVCKQGTVSYNHIHMCLCAVFLSHIHLYDLHILAWAFCFGRTFLLALVAKNRNHCALCLEMENTYSSKVDKVQNYKLQHHSHTLFTVCHLSKYFPHQNCDTTSFSERKAKQYHWTWG